MLGVSSSSSSEREGGIMNRELRLRKDEKAWGSEMGRGYQIELNKRPIRWKNSSEKICAELHSQGNRMSPALSAMALKGIPLNYRKKKISGSILVQAPNLKYGGKILLYYTFLAKQLNPLTIVYK